MIDFHTHILANVDDGSQSLHESLCMLQREQEQGVEKIIATPHFYAHRDTVSQFLFRREEAIRLLLQERQDISVLIGAEVYYFPGIGKAEQLSRLCVEGTSLLLLELPFAQWTEQIGRDVAAILEKRKKTVLLAHIERYWEFQKDKSVWNRIFQMPVYAQINTGSMKRKKKRKFADWFIRTGIPFVLGSDCHNLTERPPNLEEGRNYLGERYGSEVLKKLDETEERLLK